MDRGISAAWYDLPEKGRDEYMEWLHGTYAPRLLEHPGVLWAAHYKVDQSVKPLPSLQHTQKKLPAGNQYIFLIGAKDAEVFSALTPYNQKGKMDSTDKKMLGMRSGERRAIYTEEARVDGPHANEREGEYLLSPGIQFGNFNSGSWEEEDELLAWYADYRLPAMKEIPSSVGMRKLVSVSGWAKHGVIYEFTSIEARAKYFRAHESKNKEQAEWTDEVIRKLVHAPGSPAVAERIWPAPRRK